MQQIRTGELDSDERLSDDELEYARIAKKRVRKAKKKSSCQWLTCFLLSLMGLGVIIYNLLPADDATNSFEVTTTAGPVAALVGSEAKPEAILLTQSPLATQGGAPKKPTKAPHPTEAPSPKPIKEEKKEEPVAVTPKATEPAVAETKAAEPAAAAQGSKDSRSLLERMDLLQAEVKKTQKMLVDYYSVESEEGKMVNATWFLDSTFYNSPDRLPEEYFAGLESMAERFIRAFVYDRPFIVGVIGSSVAAGHDNCHYDCYEEQLNRLMQPVFAAAGFEFLVRNAGMTGGCGDSFTNQVWCLQSKVGDDVDSVHYSWTYFEHNDYTRHHERYIRWALSMPHRPFPVIVNTNGCNGMSGDRRKRPDIQFLGKYGSMGQNYLCMQGGTSEYGYKKQGGVIGDKIHKTTRYGEKEEEERQRSLGVVFRNWHPGPLMFQTTSDALGWNYMKAMEIAIEKIRKENKPKEKWGEFMPKLDLGDPIECDPLFCNVENAPICHDGETPHYGENFIRYIDPEDPEYPEKYKSQDYEWKRYDGGFTSLIPGKERGMKECTHLDHCGGWIKNKGKDSGWIVFKFPKVEKGIILVCFKGERKAKNGGEEAGPPLRGQAALIIELDGKETEHLFEQGKCRYVQTKYEDRDAAPDTHVLAVRSLVEGKPFLLDHVMAL